MGRRLGWGFVGASTIAREYMVKAVNADQRSWVPAVLSRSRERAEQFAATHGVATAYDSIRKFLADPAVDVVYVGNANDQHYDAVLAAAAEGKHVLCDKPLAVSLDQAAAMLKACDTAGVKLGMNHQMRQSPAIHAMKRLVADGAIGEPAAARLWHGERLPPQLHTWRLQNRDGGGVPFDLTVHVVDTLRYVFDDEIVEVTALGSNRGRAQPGLLDTMLGVMHLSRGVLASFFDSFVTGDAGNGLELHGSDGSLLARDVMAQEPVGDLYLRRGRTTAKVDVGPREDLYVRTVQSFNDAVVRDRVPSPDGRDGVMSLAVALAAAESVRTRRTTPVIAPDCVTQ